MPVAPSPPCPAQPPYTEGTARAAGEPGSHRAGRGAGGGARPSSRSPAPERGRAGPAGGPRPFPAARPRCAAGGSGVGVPTAVGTG